MPYTTPPPMTYRNEQLAALGTWVLANQTLVLSALIDSARVREGTGGLDYSLIQGLSVRLAAVPADSVTTARVDG